MLHCLRIESIRGSENSGMGENVSKMKVMIDAQEQVLQMTTSMLLRELIEGDRRLTIVQISSKVDISYGSVQSTISDQLGFRKISARWVPRLLTENQKQVKDI